MAVKAYVEPARTANEPDEAYQKRKGQANDGHTKKLKEIADWDAAYRKFLREATRDLERLRAYFAAHKPEPVGKKESIDSELAAICVLLELDNLIVAKAYREELEALLPRIPISALFEGKATYDWTIEIATEKTEPYPVTVAVLKPAQLLPGVDAQPASIP